MVKIEFTLHKDAH